LDRVGHDRNVERGRVEAYPMQHPAGGGGRRVRPWRAFIYGEDVENLVIGGTGLIHGNGEDPAFGKKLDDPNRPFGLWIVRGRNLRVEGVEMRSSAFWMQNYEDCDHVRISGIRVFNHANLNDDGLDLTDCQNVIVSDAEIDSTDDALCLKSHGNRGTPDVVIGNCVLATHASAFKMGTASVGHTIGFSVGNCRRTGCVCGTGATSSCVISSCEQWLTTSGGP
jgi:polygalacturonase